MSFYTARVKLGKRPKRTLLTDKFLKAQQPAPRGKRVEVSLPAHLARYLVAKGSITVDGISLTVVEVGDASFTVSLIPETLERTTLGSVKPGDRLNVECDVLARYVQRQLLPLKEEH